MRLSLRWLVAAFVAVPLLLAAAPAPRPTRFECTRIAVPSSRNFPVRQATGARVEPPKELSPAFQPFLTTVELPEGFTPVGGGEDQVIACRPGR